VVKISVISTPQSFGTTKLFKASEKNTRDLIEPIQIKMPITNDMFLGFGTDALKDVAVCTY
jgi:hypothetical protein